MLNPYFLEKMMDHVQAERQKEAETDALAQAFRSSDLNLREIVGNFITFIGLKEKRQLQVKLDVQQAEANVEI